MHVYGKYIDGNSLVMEATRHHNGEQVVEGVVSMALKGENLLHSKVYLRPDAMEDAKVCGRFKLQFFIVPENPEHT